MVGWLRSFLRDLSIKGKLVAVSIAAGSVSLVLAAGLIAIEQYAFEKDELLRDLSLHAEMAGQNSSAAIVFDSPEAASRNLSLLSALDDINWAALYDREGRLFASYRAAGAGPADIPSRLPREPLLGRTGQMVVQHEITRDQATVGHLLIQGDSGRLASAMGRHLFITLLVFGLALFLTYVLASRLHHIITEPFDSLLSTMAEVGRNSDYSLRATPEGLDEFGRIVAGFNMMLTEISARDALLNREVEDRIATEEALRRSEERYRTLFELAGDAIFMTDADSGIIIGANRRAHELMGAPPGTLRGLHHTELHPPEIRDDVRTIFAEHVYSGGVAHDIAVRTLQGATVPVDIVSSVVRMAGRRIVYGIFRDMTELSNVIAQLRESQKQLRRSEEGYRVLFELAGDAIILLDQDTGVIVEANRKAESLFGVDAGGLVGSHKTVLHSAEQADEYKVLFEAARRQQTAFFRNLSIRNSRGKNIPVTVSTSTLPIRGRSFVLAIFRDITEIEEMISRIRRSEEQYRRLVETIPHGIEEIDVDGVITYANDAYCSMLGFGPGELLGIPTWSLAPDPEEQATVRDYLKRLVVEQPEPTLFIGKNRTKDGRLIDIEVAWNYKRDDSGNLLGFISVITDVTEKNRAERTLRESEERFRAFADTTFDMIHLNDIEGRITYGNSATTRLLGYRLDEVVGIHAIELIHPDDRAGIAEDMRALVTQGVTPPPREIRLRKKDGSWLDAEVLGFPINIPDREPSIGAVIRDISWRKQAERTLRFAQFAVDRTQDSVFWHGEDGRFWYVNEAACRSLGYSSEELLGMSVGDVDPNFPATTWEQHWDQVRREGPRIIETVHRRKDGSLFPVEISINPLSYEGQDFHCSFARDISRRKAQQDRLRESEERFRSIASATRDMIHLFDRKRRFIYANPATEEALGYTTDEFLSFTVDELLHPDERRNVVGEIQAYLAGTRAPSSPLQVQLRKKDGSFLSVEASEFLLHAGDDTKFVGAVLRDVTERKEAEQRLRASENRYKALSKEFHGVLEAIEDPLLLLNRDLEVVWANKGALTAFPNRRASDSGTFHCFSLCHGSTSACPRCPVRDSFLSRRTETDIQATHDGRTWTLRAFPILDDSGAVRNVIKVMTDVTEKLRVEAEFRDIQERLSQTNKMTALGTLVAGIAHEINNPNNAILFHAPVLLDAWNDAIRMLARHEGQKEDFALAGIPFSEMRTAIPEMLEAIIESSTRIGGIVSNLRDFARTSPEGSFEPINLNHAVRMATTIIHNQIRKTTDNFSMDLADDLPLVTGNLHKIEQVVLNLVLNALQSLADRSRAVAISTAHDPANRLVTLRVSDEGCGMDTDILQRITEPFFTTKHDVGGMGLGLSISYSIVARHGGDLRFESEQGKGTTVLVSLPARQA